MGDCLKTQLKGTVQNNELPVLGKVRVHVNSTIEDDVESRTIRLYVISDSIVKTVNGSFTINNDPTVRQEYNCPANEETTFIFGAGEYDVYFDKYGIDAFRGSISDPYIRKTFSVDVSQFSYCPLSNFNITNAPLNGIFGVGNIASLAYITDESGVPSEDNNSVFDIDILNGKELSLLQIHTKILKGNINSLSAILGNIEIKSYGDSPNYMTGDLTTFINEMKDAGKEGTYTFGVANMHTTLYDNGNLFTNVYVSEQSSGAKVSGVKFTISDGVITKEWI